MLTKQANESVKSEHLEELDRFPTLFVQSRYSTSTTTAVMGCVLLLGNSHKGFRRIGLGRYLIFPHLNVNRANGSLRRESLTTVVQNFVVSYFATKHFDSLR